MISVDAPGHVELAFEDKFDTPVVVAMLQSGAGDASPGGSDSFYANLETVGEYAADPIYELWESTPTAADPIRLETASRSVPETHDDIHVTRNGTVDWYYPPYDPDYTPDDIVYNDDGTLAAPMDEFNTQYGAAFCGENPAYLPGYAPAQAFPYVDCVDVDKMVDLITSFFDLTEEEAALPLTESKKAYVTATRFGPVPILWDDGTQVTDDFFVGFFPGEPTSLYTEQFRRRAAAELGFEHSMAVGYSQDHEGYLLIPEDWLKGGYEADINVWGPLQAEHIMERLLDMSKEVLLTDKVEKGDPCGTYQIPSYGAETPLPNARPDSTPEAGELVTSTDYLYTPLYSIEELEAGAIPDLEVPSEIDRISGLVQFAWKGGDPGVDFPVVTLQVQADDGEFSDVLTASGRPVAGGPDILVTTTPDPLYPDEDAQTWTWYAAWQAIGHDAPRVDLPEGIYRLHVEGHSFVDDGATTWPWSSEGYSVDSPEFALGVGRISMSVAGDTLIAFYQAPPLGYRLVTMDGQVRGSNPVTDDTLMLTYTYEDGSTETTPVVGTHGSYYTSFNGAIPEGVTRIDAVDASGNVGAVSVGG
jgi:hypothetical protein